MTSRGLELEHDYHPPGEYRFTPDELTLSFCLQKIDVEQLEDVRLWAGTCLRDDVKVMPRGVPRTFRHRTGCRFVCITIPDGVLGLESARLAQLRPQTALRDVQLKHLLEVLTIDAASAAPPRSFRDAALAVVARLLELDGARAAPARNPALAPAVLARVLDYLEAHVADDVAVADLAAIAGLSPAHFATSFRASVGEPPHRHHLRLRVERARTLLQQGMEPLSAALATGFCDPSHLARHMQRTLGITPGALARSFRAGGGRTRR
jgi:AraC-like DNA-binding protein